jgi:hypothetical protein
VIDPSSDIGFQICLMSDAMAGMEWRTLRQRTQDGKREKRKLGRNVNGSATLPSGIGYQRITNAAGKTIDDRWFYDEDTVAKIREAYRILFADHGISLTALAKRVGWSYGHSLRRSLQNPVWKGLRVYAPAGAHAETLKVPPPLEPVLAPDQWALAQTLLAKRRTWSKETRDQRFLGTGLLFCQCGAKHYTHSDTRRGGHDVYFCSSRFKGKGCGAAPLRREIVDRAIERIVSESLTDAAFLAKVFARVERAPAPDPGNRERELAKLATRRQKWIEQYDADRISRKEFEDKMDGG